MNGTSAWQKFLAFENSIRFLCKTATESNELDALMNIRSHLDNVRREFVVLEEDHKYVLRETP
jgi:hypothetical protein